MVDTSALIAILLAEEGHDQLVDRILRANGAFVTPVVEVEGAIVLATKRKLGVPAALEAVRTLLSLLSIETRPVTSDMAAWAAQAYDRFGKGRHSARLNLGDCLSYAAARAAGVGLIYKGNDFSQTDLEGGIYPA